MAMKTRAKNFSSDEISSLVDLLLENKSKLFGALSCSMTFDEKNNVCEDIANEISQSHGTFRSKEYVSKKCSNVFAQHKPIISDKVLSARKTGGGSPDAELTDLEAKLKSIKGKELFEGVQGGIYICSASPITTLSDSDMSIVEEMKPPKKRKFFDESLTNTTLKKALLETVQDKIVLLRNINNKMDKMVDLFGQIFGIQNRLLSNTTSQLHPTYLPNPTTLLPPFAPQPYPSTLMKQHFPSND